MKKLIKSIFFSFLAFMFALGSIFLPIGKSSQKYASANNTTYGNVNFVSSNIIFSRLGLKTLQTSNQYDDNGLLVFSQYRTTSGNVYSEWFDFTFRISMPDFNNSVSSSDVISFYAFGNYDAPRYGVGNTVSSGAGEVLIHTITAAELSSTPDSYQFFSDNFYVYTGNTTASYDTALGCGIYYPDNYLEANMGFPSLTMVTIEVGSSFNFPEKDNFPQAFQLSNVVCYTDSLGFKFYYFLPAATANTSSTIFYNYRKYYTSYSDQFTNNQYYEQGYNDGKYEGLSLGENKGYTSGYDTGYDDGFESGKIVGGVEANNYSFFGLISAIIDAPVKILTSLFNFNFLGVNLWAFFTSILTISLVIFVIRKFMAKG